ncbi:MAG: alpha/beta fold hydrolase [Dehalococcoidia bacterium]|nr:MAG: alpha/beta fold hydrolase [Dehalococcoidia bacterium]
MEPRIQYAQTTDGVSIAFSTLGEGMPWLQTPVAPCGVLQVEWQVPEFRSWYERLARKRMLVQYDCRGTGLSERGVADYSLDAMVWDLEAVADCLKLPSFALWGSVNFGPVAIAYAARHPERVSQLMLWCTYARGSDFFTPQAETMTALVEKDWRLYTEALCHYFLGFSTGETTSRLAALIRKGVTPEEWQAAYRSAAKFDVEALLAEVKAPTLVLHRRQLPWLSVDVGTDLASRIPGAQLAVLEGAAGGYAVEDWQAVLAAVDDFLGEGEEVAAEAKPLASEDVHTILFTDMEGSTTLTQRLGDARAQDVLRTHNTIVRDALKAHSGSEIKHTGDGIMASFTSASRALECAIDIQRALAQHNEADPDTPIRVRIGLNAGEPVAEEEDLFGTAVQLAARIAAKAEGEEILVSDTLRGLVAGKGFLFSDRGDVALRGFEDPVRLFEVRWREE